MAGSNDNETTTTLFLTALWSIVEDTQYITNSTMKPSGLNIFGEYANKKL